MSALQIQTPGRQAALFQTEAHFDGLRVESVLPRPANQRFDQFLQGLNQGPARESARRGRHQQALSEHRQQGFANLPDPPSRLRRSDVAPAFSLRLQPAMKLLQRFVLEAALLAVIDLELGPLFRPQPARDEELERTSRKFLERADGRGQVPAIERLHPRRRQTHPGARGPHLAPLDQCGLKLRPRLQCRHRRTGRPRRLRLGAEQGHDQFAGVLHRSASVRTGDPLGRKIRKQPLQLVDEGRWIQGLVADIAPGIGQDQMPPGASASDVAIEPFEADLLPAIRSQSRAEGGESFAVPWTKQSGQPGRGRENVFIQAQDEGELEIGIARTIDRADQHLVQSGRNHPHAERAQPGLQDGQPIAHRHGFVTKRQGEVVQPLLGLLPDRLVHRPRGLTKGEVGQTGRRIGAPALQRPLHLQGTKQLPVGFGKLFSVRTQIGQTVGRPI